MSIILFVISLAWAHPCDNPPDRFISKNLKDLDRVSRFQRLSAMYPMYTFHCNGTSCSMNEFEKMCYIIRKELKAGKDPNMIFPAKPNMWQHKTEYPDGV